MKGPNTSLLDSHSASCLPEPRHPRPQFLAWHGLSLAVTHPRCLLPLFRTLRLPADGCPWPQSTCAPYLTPDNDGARCQGGPAADGWCPGAGVAPRLPRGRRHRAHGSEWEGPRAHLLGGLQRDLLLPSVTGGLQVLLRAACLQGPPVLTWLCRWAVFCLPRLCGLNLLEEGRRLAPLEEFSLSTPGFFTVAGSEQQQGN